MSPTELSQSEADRLLAIEKVRVSDEPMRFPMARRKAEAALRSVNGKDEFILSVILGVVKFPRFTIQLRTRQSVVLARLDMHGPPKHKNPDNSLVSPPHLHLYREGHHSNWAFSLPDDKFSNLSNRRVIWNDLMRFCNITIPPRVEWALLI